MKPTSFVMAFSFACVASAAQADPVADFYRDKVINISVGFGPGGGYDLHARTLARHFGKYVPGNPTVIVKNSPGGAGLTLVNTINNVAARDGTELATFDRSIPIEPLIGASHAKFDPKAMTWIGSTSREVSTCVAWETAPIKTIEDLYKTELLVSGTGPAADVVVYPRMMNAVLGTKFKIVTGYKDSAEALLAMERGETRGFCAWGWSTMMAIRPEWVKAGKIRPLVQFGQKKHPEHLDVPLVLDLARTPQDRAALEAIIAPQLFARPFAGPPGVPPERVAALRKAFAATLNDPAYRADADKAGIEYDLVRGEEIDEMLAQVYATPKDVIDRIRAALK